MSLATYTILPSFQLSINDPNLNPPPPKNLKEIISSKEFMSIIHSVNNKIK
jgi:hypothetical protein